MVVGSSHGVGTVDGSEIRQTHQFEQWKNLGWLGYIGDSTTQLYRDHNKPL